MAKTGVVGAVIGGADWLQQFCTVLCLDAVRFLDFPQAVEHLRAAAQAVYGPGTEEESDWRASAAGQHHPVLNLRAITGSWLWEGAGTAVPLAPASASRCPTDSDVNCSVRSQVAR
jgi:hypothetical protein